MALPQDREKPRAIVPVGDVIGKRIEELIDKAGGLRNRLSHSVDAIVGTRPESGIGGPTSVPNGLSDRLDLLSEALDRLAGEISRLEHDDF